MQFPLSWLREFCNPALSTEELANTFTMAGLEVEECQAAAPPFHSVVVGEIKEAVQHPDADRLRVCQVDVGQPELLNIVCGAANARVGIKVPCAMVGAQMPAVDGKPGWAIKAAKLRGVPSQGMLCAARELGLQDAADGLLELPLDAPVGTDIRQYLNLDDAVLTLKLTPNLAHCLSIYGLARELSALTGTPLNSPVAAEVPAQHTQTRGVKISAPDLCGRFSGRLIRNVNAKAATPAWMVERLQRCGQRSISALVDISNYLMLELGQPTHMFDADTLQGDLEVRWARDGEKVELLDGSVAELDSTVGVVAHAQGVAALAGVMGGNATAVSDTTQNVYLEAAFWWPSAIAGRARRFKLSSEAAHRFERGVDPSTVRARLERLTQLVLEICGGEVGPVEDQIVNVPTSAAVKLRVSRASKILGMPLTAAQCVELLTRLELQPQVTDADVITVTPPAYRFDLRLEEDLIEEVARLIGYNNLPTDLPLGPITPKVQPQTQRSPYAVRRLLASLGYQETINYSFVEERWERELAGNEKPIRLLNPISSNMSVMRSSLLGSLLSVVKFNQDRKVDRLRVFEIGRVFLRDDTVQESYATVAGFHQPMFVSGISMGAAAPLQWSNTNKAGDFFDIKGDVEMLLQPLQAEFVAAEHPAMHPGRCAQILWQGRSIGFVGELHPRWVQAYELTSAPVMFELDLATVLTREPVKCTDVPKAQAVYRDVALVVAQSVTHDALMKAVSQRTAKSDLLCQSTLFDVYQPQQEVTGMTLEEKSLAVRLELRSKQDTTLTEVEIDLYMKNLIEDLHQSVGARLR